MQESRAITFEKALNFASEQKIHRVFETSAKTGFNFEKIFATACKEVYLLEKAHSIKKKEPIILELPHS